ncbi:MAG: right-handed parallel beta-helix repeat-containing protein [Candidatus Acidiferrales bacterium]
MIGTKACVRLFAILAMGFFGAVLGQPAQAGTVEVGSCKKGVTSYSTIQKAVNAAPAGSIIDVCPGTYPEQVSITKNLTLTGILAGTADAPTVVPPSAGLVTNATDPSGGNPVAAQIVVSSPATSVTIEHLTVDGNGNKLAGCDGSGSSVPLMVGHFGRSSRCSLFFCTAAATTFYYQNVSGTITQNAIRNQLQDTADQNCPNGLGIYVESGGGATTTVTISNNTIHSYQQNGITANGYGDGSAGPSVTIENNTVDGAVSTSDAAKNGIQVGFGATGKVTGNTSIDNIWSDDSSADNGDAGVGILVIGSSGITVSENTIGNAQFGIVTESIGTSILADETTITGNKIIGTQIFDGIDLCSNKNTATGNVINSSTEAGIHMDDSCGSTGNSNTAKGNTINEACAAVLTGSGTTGNVDTPNTMFNVINTVLAGDTCSTLQNEGPSAASAPSGAKRGVARIAPYPPKK